jgi:predicted HTH transcriptional regulator
VQKPIDSLTIEDLRALVANGVSEGRSLEYKEELPGGSSGDRKEFLADVSAFANTSGGWLLYGISEERDDAGKPTGVPREMRGVQGNQDAEMLRLDSIARDGIEPRIHGLRWRAIPLTDSAFVLVCWVPKSLHSPHMVWFEKCEVLEGRERKYQSIGNNSGPFVARCDA